MDVYLADVVLDLFSVCKSIQRGQIKGNFEFKIESQCQNTT